MIKKILNNVINMPKRFFSKVACTAIIYNSYINKDAAISGKTRFYNSKIDKYSYIGRNNLVTNTIIGKFCSIADNCVIGAMSHPVSWVSTSPVFQNGKNILNKNFIENEYEPYQQTKIENDVWIGCNVLIKNGVTIGTGAVIGMGSVVVKDVEPYSIVAGVPAKKIKDRFQENEKEKLLKSKWWNLTDEQIKHCANYINDCEKFIIALKEVKYD